MINTVLLLYFQLSMVLRSVHSVLVEDYGLPTWGSYLVFALATIFVGALLGLVSIRTGEVSFKYSVYCICRKLPLDVNLKPSQVICMVTYLEKYLFYIILYCILLCDKLERFYMFESMKEIFS